MSFSSYDGTRLKMDASSEMPTEAGARAVISTFVTQYEYYGERI